MGFAWFGFVRRLVALGQWIDRKRFGEALQRPLDRPVVIVGNPRSGTTFLHRYLARSGLLAGSQLYGMVFPSVTLRRVLRPLLPLLEVVSPARFHRSAAHHTSLSSEETDDVLVFLRFLDGFFLYGFIWAWADEDLLDAVDPSVRDTFDRDMAWSDRAWRTLALAEGADRVVIKSFTLGANLPAFLERYPDARVLYLVRDPVQTIPSGLSLITGVLDNAFGLDRVDPARRQRYHDRIYAAFIELYRRFIADWSAGRIDRSRVMVVPYSRMMADFDGLMDELLAFAELDATPALRQKIAATASRQRAYTSAHRYGPEDFGLDGEQIRRDCAFVYEAFPDLSP